MDEIQTVWFLTRPYIVCSHAVFIIATRVRVNVCVAAVSAEAEGAAVRAGVTG